MVRYWTVRMRPDIDTDPEDDFWEIGQNEGFVGIGWSDLGDITTFSENDKDSLVEKLEKTYQYYSDIQAITAANQILRFLHHIDIHDFVILPTYPEEGIVYLIGRVKKPAQYNKKYHVVTRNVDWITRIPRERLSDPLKKSLKGRLTLFNVDQHEKEIGLLIKRRTI
jgi:predicted Mrr-cat superfamily restriction endonuclease